MIYFLQEKCRLTHDQSHKCAAASYQLYNTKFADPFDLLNFDKFEKVSKFIYTLDRKVS